MPQRKREESAFPASSLNQRPGLAAAIAPNCRFVDQPRLEAGFGKLDTKSQIFDHAAADLPCPLEQSEGQGHAGTRQMDTARQSLQAPLPDGILHEECKGRDLHQRGSPQARPNQIDRLAWPVGRGRFVDNCAQAGDINRAVGVEDHNDIGRRTLQLGGREGQGEPLSAVLLIVPLDHLVTCLPSALGGVVGAIVGDDKNAHAVTERVAQRAQRGNDDGRFIVRGNDDHCGPAIWRAAAGRSRAMPVTTSQAKNTVRIMKGRRMRTRIAV